MFFSCTVPGCDKLFNCKKALKEHERTHNQDRPFKCDLCDQTFTQYSSLQKHARVHDKKKPYQCDHEGCNQAFSQVSNLIRHQRIHSGDKPYECQYCDKRFASGSNLKQHLQIHDKQVIQIPLTCQQDNRNQFLCMFRQCGKKYLYQSSLKKHYTVSHKEEYELYLQEQDIQTCGFHLREQSSGGIYSNQNNSQQDETHEPSAQSKALERPLFQNEQKKEIINNQNDALSNLAEDSAQTNQQGVFKVSKKAKESQQKGILSKRQQPSPLKLDDNLSNFKRIKQNGLAARSSEHLNLVNSQRAQVSINNCFINYYPYHPQLNGHPNEAHNDTSLYNQNLKGLSQQSNGDKPKENSAFTPTNFDFQNQSPLFHRNPNQHPALRHETQAYKNFLQQQLIQFTQSGNSFNRPQMDIDNVSDFIAPSLAPYQTDAFQPNSPYIGPGMSSLPLNSMNYERQPQHRSLNGQSPSHSHRKIPVVVLSQNNRGDSSSTFKKMSQHAKEISNAQVDSSNDSKSENKPQSEKKFPLRSGNTLSIDLDQNAKSLNGEVPNFRRQEDEPPKTGQSVVESLYLHNITQDIEDINKNQAAHSLANLQRQNQSSAFSQVKPTFQKQILSTSTSPKSANSLVNGGNLFGFDKKKSTFFKRTQLLKHATPFTHSSKCKYRKCVNRCGLEEEGQASTPHPNEHINPDSLIGEGGISQGKNVSQEESPRRVVGYTLKKETKL